MVYFVNVIHELSTPNRRRKKLKKTEVIINEAMDIVLQHGFEGLTMARLAKRLDLTAGALYRYFSSTEVLIAELEARAISKLHSLIDAERAAWRESLREDEAKEFWGLCELVAVGHFYQGLIAAQPRLFALVSKTLADPQELVADTQTAAKVALSLSGLLGCVTELFETAHAEGSLAQGSAEERTAVYWAAHHGTLQTDKLGRFSDTLRASRLAPALRRSLLLGWGATEDSIIRAEAWTENKRTRR